MKVEKTNTGNKFYGQAVGIVKQINTDGTYKVWIPGVYDAEFFSKPEFLPNAVVLHPPYGNDGVEYSIGFPLMEETKVFVFFESGDISKPIIFGKYLSETVYESLASEHQINLNRKCSIRVGKSIISLKEDGNIEISVLPKASDDSNPISSIVMDENGNIVLKGNNITISSKEDFKLSAKTVESEADTSTKISSEHGMVLSCSTLVMCYDAVTKLERKFYRKIAGIASKTVKSAQTILGGWLK